MAAALDLEARGRLDRFLSGVEAYLGYDRQIWDAAAPVPPEHAQLWGAGTTRLVDMGGFIEGPPVLVVPSLVNRARVLNLRPGGGFLSLLSEWGPHPYLLDWGEPGLEERGFDCAAYVQHRLLPALEALVARQGRPVSLMGYCMGGILTLAAAVLRPDLVDRLVFLATPFDFHAEGPEGPEGGMGGAAPLGPGALGRSWGPVLATWQGSSSQADATAADTDLGEGTDADSSPPPLPVDVVQLLFALLDPGAIARKYTRFAALDPGSDAARDFVLLEDWVNDGVPLAAPVARECLEGWYGDNVVARGQWQIAGVPIRAETVRHPALVVVPDRDRIVPPKAALALSDALCSAETLEVPLGHVSMVAGRRASHLVIPNIAKALMG